MNWVPRWSGDADSPRHARDGIESWVRSEALWHLVRHWEPDARPIDDATEALEWLDAFSGRHWNFRGGRERNLAASARLSDAQSAAALDLSPQLGLAPSWPSERAYDAVVMTGGMVRAGIVKPRFVRRLIDDGVTFGRVSFVGAHRAFAGDEIELGAALGVAGDDEVDGMVAGMRQAFMLRGPERASSGEGSARASAVRWFGPGGGAFEVVAAPSARPEERRANTADTFRYWAEQVGERVRSVLVVTTPIYVPYQAAVATEIFGIERGMRVETVGIDAASNDLGEHTQRFDAQHHLQELRSAIRGLRGLERNSILRSARM